MIGRQIEGQEFWVKRDQFWGNVLVFDPNEKTPQMKKN